MAEAAEPLPPDLQDAIRRKTLWKAHRKLLGNQGIVQEIVESVKSSHVFLISVSSRSFCQMSTPRFVFLALREQLQLPKIFLGSA